MLQSIVKNVSVSFIGRVFGSALALVSLGFMARMLGTDGFGEYATILAYLAVFQLFADFGFHTLLTREITQHPNKEKELVSQFITLRIVIVVVFLAVACGLIFLFPYSDSVKAGVVIAASGVFAMSLSQIFLGVLQKHFVVYKGALAEVMGRVVQLALIVLFFYTGGGLYHILIAFLASVFITLLINIFFVRKIVRFSLAFSIDKWKAILKNALPVAVSIIFTLLYFKADTILLSLMKDAEAVGLYNIAYKVLEAFIFFPAALFGILMPVLSKQAQKSAVLGKTLSVLSHISVLVVVPFVIGGVLVSSSILNIIGGEEFLDSTLTLQVLFVAMGFIVFGNLFGNTGIALNIQKKTMIAYILGFVFNVVANLIVIPIYSYQGAAVTTLATEIIVTISLGFIIYKHAKFQCSPLVFCAAMFAGALMAGALLLLFPTITQQPLSPVYFGIAVATGAGVYGIVSFVFVKKWATQAISYWR